MKLISFRISGAFAAFRDPSVTSNQTVYYIPSKSAVIGMIGAMIGVNRSDTLDELYSDEYMELFKNTKIGIKFESEPQKVTFFTNHRSLKEPKTKPFKTELLEKPTYTIYVDMNDDNYKKLIYALQKNEFVFSPYLGHAYCLAIVFDFKEFDTHEINPVGEKTYCVILDESETYNPDFELIVSQSSQEGSVIIERHIHHFFNDEKFDGRVLKHWIPVKNTEFKIKTISTRTLSKFYNVGDHVVCMY